MKFLDDKKLILAPMAGYSDLPFRILASEYGADMVFTEMVSAKALSYDDEKTKKLLRTDATEKNVAVQIFGKDPEIVEKITKKLDMDDRFISIDLNLGCPAPKIVKNGEGSFLLNNPELIFELLTAMRKATKKPISAKIRLGFENYNYKETIKAIESAGADFLTVHGRTAKMMYSGNADWDAIGEIKASVKIPVVGNGDIQSPEAAKNAFEKYKVDAIMIGRAAIGNPFLFKAIKSGLEGQNYAAEISEIFRCMYRQIEMEINLKGERVGVQEIRKHIHGYIRGFKNSTKLKNEINMIKNKAELLAALRSYENYLLTYC